MTVFEKNTIGSGTTAKSAATFCLIDDSVAHEFWSVRLFGFKFYTGLEREEPGSTGFEKTGTLTVAPYRDYEMYVLQAVDLTVASGYHAEYWRDHEKIRSVIPDLTLDGVLGAGWCPDDGFFDATMIANTLAQRTRASAACSSSPAHRSPTSRPRRAASSASRADGSATSSISWSTPPAPGRALRRAWSASSCRSGTRRPRSSSSRPRKELGYPFPVLKYPRFYARSDKDNVFICKAHMTMDLSDPVHAGIWDPDELPMSGGTDEYFWEFLTEQLAGDFPRLLESSHRQRVGRLSRGATGLPADPGRDAGARATCSPAAPAATA